LALAAGLACAHDRAPRVESPEAQALPPAPYAVAVPQSASLSPDLKSFEAVPVVAYEGEAERCIDRELLARRLNPWGDPEGTSYQDPSGPLGVSATRSDRFRYVVRRHPAIGASCTRSALDPQR
jgi:hypothetical protein